MEYLNGIAKEGVLGILLAASLATNYWLIKLLLYEKDKRIADALETKTSLMEPISFIKDSLGIIKDKILVSKGRK